MPATIAAELGKKRFIFAYTNEQVDLLNRFARDAATEDEARRESEKERLAEIARLKARREAEQREDRIAKEQADRLSEQPDEIRREHERLRSRQQQFDDYNAEQRRIGEGSRGEGN
jgi:hypothetical protein